jgi:prepilin-type N-terminal cleavage/methylation domain-containing protein
MLKNKFKGFTLVEVLLVVAIVGIISAITIPSIITKYQKKVVETKLKEDYAIFQQVIRSNLADGVSMDMTVVDGSTQILKTFVNTYFAHYMKISKICVEKAGCWQSKTQNKDLKNNKLPNGWDRGGIGIGSGIITLRLDNGTNLCIDGWGGGDIRRRFGVDTTSNSGLTIYIDANGDSGPNRIGKDIYVLTYTSDNGILPAGYHKTASEIDKNCSLKYTDSFAGAFCLLKVQKNNWKISNEVWK